MRCKSNRNSNRLRIGPCSNLHFIISAFTVGGGFVLIPLMKAKFVDEYHWISEKEALDLVAIAQSAPGAVAINAAIIMGYRMGKVKGLLPPCWARSCRRLLR
jgi:chromate transport protein ChrA